MGFLGLRTNNDCVIAGAGRKESVMIEELNSLLRPAGLFYRGGFHPEVEMAFPPKLTETLRARFY